MIIFNFIKYLYLYIKYNKIIQKAYKDENLIQNLSQLLGVKIHKDWVGRLYMVLNPALIGGEFQQNTMIFEFTEQGMTNNSYIEKWIMDRLLIAQKFIRANNLFDLLTYDLKRIDEYDNYLFVIKPLVFDKFLKWTKRFVLLLGVLILIGIGLLIYINLPK